MKTINILFLVTISLLVSSQLFAQARLLDPSFTFSKKDTSYFTLSDGTEVAAYLKGIKRKKQQIKEITIKTFDGKKKKLLASDIKHMYLKPSGFDKFAKAMAMTNDPRKWSKQDDGLDDNRLGNNYVYFEQSSIKIKKKTYTLLLQLLNPSFCNKVRVYFNPYASETTSVGIGGFKVAGGDMKRSYYFKKAGDKKASKMKRKEYKRSFDQIFSDCPDIVKKYGEKPRWPDMPEHLYEYDSSCN